MALSLLDDYNRADGGVGSHYSDPGYIVTLPSIISNQVTINPGGAESAGLWNVSSFGTDQEMQITVATGDGGSAHLYLLLCGDHGTAGDGYFFDLTFSGTTSSGTLTVVISRLNTYVATALSGTLGPYSWAAGDTWGARRVGGDLSVVKNLIALATVTDSSPLAHGGLIGYGGRGSTNIRVDDLYGGIFDPPVIPGPATRIPSVSYAVEVHGHRRR